MTRLLVLWLLSERPLYGYEITRSLSDSGMRFWFAVEEASIYSVLRTLARNGYAVEQVEDGDTGRPRRRYTITAAGRAYHRELLREALADPVLRADPVDVALAASADLTPGEVRDLLAQRAATLRALLVGIERNARAAPDEAIVRRRRALAAAELAWLETHQETTIDKEGTR